ncbi:hypothetical protein VE00_03283 [Pseudogymnoascus sp. WSF 3629]|nr:hypothetical protein VE00_03283 [Pseudogymnoascus sp. WSF 3629]
MPPSQLPRRASSSRYGKNDHQAWPRSQLPRENNGLIRLAFVAGRYAACQWDVNELYAIRERIAEQDLLRTGVVFGRAETGTLYHLSDDYFKESLHLISYMFQPNRE